MIYSKENLSIKEFCGDDSRPILNGVAFYHDKTVATDSYVLVEVGVSKQSRLDEVPQIPNYQTLKYIQKEPIVVNKKAIEKVIKNMPSNSHLPVLNNVWLGTNTKGETAEFLMTDLETATPILTKITAGEFPKYEQIIPTGKGKSMNVNPAIMKKAMDFLVKAGIKNCQISMFENDKPILITAETENKQKIRILVMPLRKDN